MKKATLNIGKLKSGWFKVYVWGQPDFHTTDLRGSNYRTKSVSGQPHNGFFTYEDALSWAKNRFKTQYDFEYYVCTCGNGMFMNVRRFDDLELRLISGYMMTT
jgi:hypothetical protein